MKHDSETAKRWTTSPPHAPGRYLWRRHPLAESEVVLIISESVLGPNSPEALWAIVFGKDREVSPNQLRGGWFLPEE